MTRFWSSAVGVNWHAAALLGLISSTFSTLVSQFTAAWIGRDAIVDWMVVAAIPLRNPVLQVEPSCGVILVGILFHQCADFSQALVFFGLFGRCTVKLQPRILLLISSFWALLTSSLEWLFLVPVLPFWQPIFTLEQPYWIGFLVHLQRFTAVWSGSALLGLEPQHARALRLAQT